MTPNGNNASAVYSPLVSVIIPSKNRPDLVVSAVTSVINQTYANIEIIVVDDGSVVHLAPVLHKIFSDKVLCVRNDVGLGAPAARNAGARIASGQFIAFLDDDDLWVPSKLERQLSSFRTLGDDFGVVYCGYDFIVRDAIVLRKNCYHANFDLYITALNECPVGSPTPLIRKKYFDMVGGFDSSLPSCQDWDLWIRISQVCKFYPVKESLALYRIHGDQISTNMNKKIEARKMLIDKHFNELKNHSRILSSHFSRVGSLCVMNGNDKEARKYFRKAIANNPFNVGSMVHLLLQVLCKPLEKRLVEHFAVNTIYGIRVIH